MNPQAESEIIKIAEVLCPDLAIRSNARRFYSELEASRIPSIKIDFSGVRSISRGFAQEYLNLKKKLSKDIRELNVPDNVRKMFEAVEAPSSNGPVVDMDNMPVTYIE